MDWDVDARDRQSVRRLRHEFASYLRQRADAGSDVGAAEAAFAELLANVHRHAVGPASVHLEWEGDVAVLTIRDRGPGFSPEVRLPDDPAADGGRGLYIVAKLVGEISVRRADAGGAEVSVTLPVRRRAACSFH
jgi:anti-sigma regulatory factor (Ser/Thr protein kinase)